MSVVLVKLSPDLHRAVVDSAGALLSDLLYGRAQDAGFDGEADVLSGYDHRDLVALAIDDDDPILQLFEGDPLVDGYDWTYGPPAWFDPAATEGLREGLADDADFWPQSEFVAFFDRAIAEGKGVVIGVS